MLVGFVSAVDALSYPAPLCALHTIPPVKHRLAGTGNHPCISACTRRQSARRVCQRLAHPGLPSLHTWSDFFRHDFLMFVIDFFLQKVKLLRFKYYFMTASCLLAVLVTFRSLLLPRITFSKVNK
jgi:hypothetical protein